MKLRRICILKFFSEKNSGFTLIETLIVSSLVAIVSAFALAMSLDTYRGYNFRSEQGLLLSLLQKARNQSINNIDQLPHGLHIGSGEYTLFEGTTWNSRTAAQDITFPIGKGATVQGMQDVIFAQLSGAVSATGTIVMHGAGQNSTISINNEGQINLQ